MVTIKSIEPLTLSKLITTVKDKLLIIDVREPIEYQRERITGTINIPLGKIGIDIHFLPLGSIEKVIILCQAGVRSLMACEKLNKEGLPVESINLSGGINNWKTHGLKTIQTIDLS